MLAVSEADSRGIYWVFLGYRDLPTEFVFSVQLLIFYLSIKHILKYNHLLQ